jgi:hypothetical protein
MKIGAALALGIGFPHLGHAQDDAPAAVVVSDTVTEPPYSARGAFLRSLILPGWGQAYVGAPGRGAVYFALEAGSLWMVYRTNAQLDEARDYQEWLRESGRIEEQRVIGLVNSREQQREDWIALSLFLFLFSAADALVAAQLADFDDHIGVRPGTNGELRIEGSIPLWK